MVTQIVLLDKLVLRFKCDLSFIFKRIKLFFAITNDCLTYTEVVVVVVVVVL